MENKQNLKMKNVPNILSLLRMVLVPVCVAFVYYAPIWFSNELSMCLIPTILFIITSFTDMLDGKIARKYNLVSDFGKFIDPLADKFMVFGLLVAILASPLYASIRGIFLWVSIIVMLRELGITSLRLVVASKGVVVAASWWGKIKTVTQIVSLVVVLMEPYFLSRAGSSNHIFSYIFMAAIAITTIGSGADYFIQLWPYLSGKK